MRVKTGSSQSNLFDILKHADSASQRKSSLDRLDVIDWETFRALLEERLSYGDQSKGGRIPWCPVLMLKVLVLQRFFDLSDQETEFQILDRFSFLRFVGLRPGDGSPDHATIWSFKERLGAEGMVAVFELFNEQLRTQGLIASCGKIIDASFIEAPKQRNRRHENEQIKRGEVPERIAKRPRRACQKDLDARWTQKNHVSYFGYKNHVKVDAASKFIETFTVTNAAVHDSQPVGKLLRESDREAVLWADSAYVGPFIAALLKGFAMLANICEKGTAARPLSREQKRANRQKSRIRSRVEHAFGRIAQFGGDRFRRIGQRRCRFETALTNLTYNLDRYAMFHARG
ncbi:IS5 family transposase [Ruficoccus amylovorans]|uniref:IS5 family transposase n=1 Tax=Ruficoccus amylovorans TaxID=1804625 RepID=A0A842HDL4_9BACT|nr:IS5 family transposase [Ruficoccus amylovorans]MBC2594616.1 IS5 family transposase [Ruficoccus amylovorans]MBC2594621.1 IS5 family transposase [Ruficoccus amylovorans]MBC2594633.1 IS5 family transposase [Ruficoccus amylovorans]MBC2594635.1 IS5 family transposase [Ruficoccus amylovorans]MBC2594644.1 IS5 family transposase [Ruficoccus amylovorans]